MDKRSFRVVLVHEYKLGHNATEATLNINRAWGANTTDDRKVQRWFNKFKFFEDMVLEDTERSKGLSSCDDNQPTAESIEADTKLLREAAERLGVSVASISRHLEEIKRIKRIDLLLHQRKNKLEFD